MLVLLHSYVVYPMLARLICRGQRRRITAQPGASLDAGDGRVWPAISVLVPAFNEADVIAGKIENLMGLDYPADRIEILIFDDGSSDRTVAVAEQAISGVHDGVTVEPAIRLIRGMQRRGKASAVNSLAGEARYDLWLLTDANVIMDRQALKHLAGQLEDPKVGAVTGPVVLVDSGESFQQGEILYYQIERSIQVAESLMGSVMGVDGGMYLVRRESVPPLPHDTILDDFTVSMAVMRQGQRIVYCKQAYATECGTVSARQEFRRRVRIAAGAVQLVGRGWLPKVSQPWLWFEFVSHKLIRWMSPVLLISAALALFGLGVFSGSTEHSGYRWAAVFGAAVSVLALAVSLLPVLQRSALGSVVHYLVLSQVAIGVGLIKGIFHMQPPQWEKADRVMERSQ
ncbi:Poly-beta-1,6-N-acetyl-D-glucosamine synthase [Allorhodopirellula heiligendammensis]|uniref:Poly-beta-1,6-N-acetyl-D-glucosamine synthase n=2 Tax=Allorhodopirellula heiligendammensis TaxID=2714739 RepID=A0A5C6C5X2_9BACT|nr:Poly-beta-1,6-N-acetyl-D-glucosamine synthase [Allorhodopirellula heiligendammensis]